MSVKIDLLFRWLRKYLLLLLILTGVVLGFLVGALVNEKVQDSGNPSPREIAMYIYFPGELFLRMLNLLVLPLIASSPIVSLAVLDRKTTARLGKRAIVCFLITTFLAVTLGVLLACILKPGGDETRENRIEKENVNAIHAILDLIRNIVPDNIVEAAFSFSVTKYKKKVSRYTFVNKTFTEHNKTSAESISLLLKNELIIPWSVSYNGVQVIKEENPDYEFDGIEKQNSANILGILVFSLVLGAILNILGENGKPLVQLFSCLFEAMMKMVEIIMWFSPVGISSIIAGKLAGMEDIKGSVQSLGLYIITVIVTCLIHALVTLPTIYFLTLRKNPYRLMIHVAKALLTSFGTGSSSATIPIALKCLEKNHKVNPRVTQFVLPVGTTVNKHGTGIYNAVAAIYIIQNQHVGSLNFSSCLLISFSAVLASLAAAPIPGSAPIVTKTIVLQAVGIRSADIGLILAVDWLVTRVTSTLNVWGNCIASVIIEHLSREQLSFDGKKEIEHAAGCTVDFEINVAVAIEEDEETDKQSTS